MQAVHALGGLCALKMERRALRRVARAGFYPLHCAESGKGVLYEVRVRAVQGKGGDCAVKRF